MPESTGSTDHRSIAANNSRSSMYVDQLHEQQFGMPPNIFVGVITAIFGAGAGAVSLVIFFYVWNPHHYVTPDWLMFVMIGAFAGFFLRLERPLYRELYRSELHRRKM